MSARQPCPNLAWYDVANPQSPDLDELAKRFRLHELQIEDCRHRPQRAKSEDHPGYIFAVLKKLHLNEDLSFHDLDLFIGKDFLITVHEGESELVEKVVKRALDQPLTRLDKLAYVISDVVVDEYIAAVDQFAEEIGEIEDEVLENPDPLTLSMIFALKRKLIEFRRVVAGMREVVNSFMRREASMLGDDLDVYFRDIYDHLVRTLDLVETHRDLLTGSLDIYLSAVANRTNDVMKVLAIYGTVALPLVIITGFFGMNLHLPWSEKSNGVWYAVAMMLTSTALVLIYFKRKGWF
jgi:magnesium transporter